MTSESSEHAGEGEVAEAAEPPACSTCGAVLVGESALHKHAQQTDGRGLGEWETRYSEDAARSAIRFEAKYVFGSLLFYSLASLAVACESVWLYGDVSKHQWLQISPYLLAFFGGCFGGTLFSMKWLYHTVAKGKWNIDRRLWRIFTPFLSGGGALVVVSLSASGVIPVFGKEAVQSNVGAFGIAVLLGYFSDRVFSAMEGFADQNLPAKKKS